jgi:ankyrin repeat protein
VLFFPGGTPEHITLVSLGFAYTTDPALLHAAKYGDEERVRQLLERGEDPDVSNDADQAPLHMAAFYGYEGAIGFARRRVRVVGPRPARQEGGDKADAEAGAGNGHI